MEYILKVCRKHGLTEFLYNKSEDRYRCRQCRIDAVTDKRRKLKENLVKYKGGKCEICGYDKCITALEFHHINPNEKEFGLASGNIKGLETLKKEVDKCILICSNCHQEIHQKECDKKIKEKQELEEFNMLHYIENLEKYKDIDGKEHNEIEDTNHRNVLKDVSKKDFIAKFIECGMDKSKLSKFYNVKRIAIQEYGYNNDIPWQEDKINKYCCDAMMKEINIDNK